MVTVVCSMWGEKGRGSLLTKEEVESDHVWLVIRAGLPRVGNKLITVYWGSVIHQRALSQCCPCSRLLLAISEDWHYCILCQSQRAGLV